MTAREHIPYGYCHCGCGQKTTISDRTRQTPRGWWVQKGEPNRYLRGHEGRRPFSERYEVQDLGYKTPCWVWKLRPYARGYGRYWTTERVWQAHRYSWELHHGPIPDGLDLDHLCRNRPCVNPDHLEPVTRRENLRRGPRALSAEEVAEIKRLRQVGLLHREIADRIGRHEATVCRVLTGKHFRA